MNRIYRPHLACACERRLCCLQIALVTGLEEASGVGRCPQRREMGCWLRFCLWHTVEVPLLMLEGTLRSCVSWGDSPSLRPVPDRNLGSTRAGGRVGTLFSAHAEDFLVEYGY